MRQQWSPLLLISLCLCFFVLMTPGCSPDESTPSTTPRPSPTITPTAAATVSALPNATATPTPTATAAVPQLPSPTVTLPVSACAGLTGSLEVSVQVGPAEVAGLEPVAVGQIPFSTSGSVAPFTVSGSGNVDYSDILQQEWGTYAVTLNMQATITGSCSGAGGSEQLDLVIEMTGEQLVVVTAEGFQNEYPWSGTHTFELEFPVMNGATNEGEGWAFTLLLSGE